MDDFANKNLAMIKEMHADDEFAQHTKNWYLAADKFEYSYHFTWLGMPIIQYPQDIIAMQEIVYQVQPDLIVETGVARGGSIIFYASLLKLLGGSRQVIGIDIELRRQNNINIQQHFLFPYITLLEGSSIDPKIVQQVYKIAKNYQRVLLVLDACHSHQHVLAELQYYERLVAPPSYIVVFDTQVENTPQERFAHKPWGPGNSPMTAVQRFLQNNTRFQIDTNIEAKLKITECPSGYLKCCAYI